MVLLIAIPFYFVAKETAGNSMLPANLINEFNYTAAMEWLREAGNLPKTFFILTICLASSYYLLWVFISGGIIHTLNSKNYSMKQFWSGSSSNFFRFLGVSGTVLIAQILMAVIIFSVLALKIDFLTRSAITENEFVEWSIGAGALFLLIFLFLSTVSDYAKCYLLLNKSINIFAAPYRSFIFTIKHFLNIYALRILLFATPLLAGYLYWKVSSNMAGATTIGLIALVLVRQVFIAMRIWFRLWTYSSQFEMCLAYFNSDKQMNKELRLEIKRQKKEAKRKKREQANPKPNQNTEDQKEENQLKEITIED